jgi:hypothetical protein
VKREVAAQHRLIGGPALERGACVADRTGAAVLVQNGTVDAETRTTFRGLVDDRRRRQLRERGYLTSRESLASCCYDIAAGDPLLALWYAIVWTMIEQGSLPRSRLRRFERAPARVVDTRGDESQDRYVDAERRESLALAAAGDPYRP